jgi:hypothetical protein
MRLRLWWWRKIREADILGNERDTFERYGEAVIGSVLAGGLTPRAPELRAIYHTEQTMKPAIDWLTERGDSHEQREQRLESVEWAILVFVFLGVILDFLMLRRQHDLTTGVFLGDMSALSSPSKSTTSAWLNISEGVLLLFGVLLVVGLLGEYSESTRLKKWSKAFNWMVIIGVSGELIADGGIFLFSKHLQTISDAEVAKFNIEAGEARKLAGEAVERAASADLARVKLEASMMWRHLSEEQQQRLCSALSPKRANQSMILSSPQDPEAWSYAAEFADELRRCAISGGFAPGGHLGTSMWSSNVKFGVWVKFSKNPNWDISLAGRERIATSLRKALEGAGLKIAGILTKEDASGFIDIYVGPRFPPHAEEIANAP